MTLNELVYDLLERYQNIISDDIDIDFRKVAFWVHNQRALWISNNLKKLRYVQDVIAQEIRDVELEIVDNINIGGLNLPIGKKVLRSKIQLPKFITGYNRDALLSVNSLDITNPKFTLIQYDRAPYIASGKTNKNEIYTFLYNGRLYFIGNRDSIKWKGLRYVNVYGIFDNPEDVAPLLDRNGNTIWDWDSPYPLNRDMYDYMKAEILKLDFGVFIIDKENDANSSEATKTK